MVEDDRRLVAQAYTAFHLDSAEDLKRAIQRPRAGLWRVLSTCMTNCLSTHGIQDTCVRQ